MIDKQEEREEIVPGYHEVWETHELKGGDIADIPVLKRTPLSRNISPELALHAAQDRVMAYEGWLDEYYQNTYPDNPVEEVKAREGFARRMWNGLKEYARSPRLRPLAAPTLAALIAACTPGVTPTPIPTPSVSPAASPTEAPTTTPEPTTSPTVEPTPSPTAEITPSPSPEPTPIDSMLEVWENMTTIDRWVDTNGAPKTFGLLENSPELPKDQRYTGVILGAKKLGDNDGVLYVGMEDYFRNKYVVTFKLNRDVVLDPTNDNYIGSVFDGGDIENIWSNELFDRMATGRYVGSIINFYQPVIAENGDNSSYGNAVRQHENQSRSLLEYALGARDGDSTLLERPEFINNSNAPDGPLLALFAILER